jgi:TonB family protein
VSRWVLALAAVVLAAQPSTARFRAGALPPLPSAGVGGGEVVLELAIEPTGAVGEIRTLRDTPPYTEALRAAVAGWTFEPARGASGEPTGSRVLVAASYRPPTLIGPAAGEPPRDVAPGSPEVPFPTAVTPALYPPTAQGDGQVLAEALVGSDGTPTAVHVVQGAGGFNAAALQAARQWRFRPAAGASRVYLVFGFRQPAMLPPRAP